ncbi:sugar 3,4-ketoisomerase [Bacillus sp. CGMCC 1.16607]|uniref:sugar 3,4-ketoisomerase n=1 Tax=Bacillus sp. CGMCC 1.16607 TaxID=3351842 RepID=UPI00363BD348
MKDSLLDFPVIGDQRGSLVALEQFKNIPFEIKRVYYIYGNKHKKARGFHAHYDLQQVLICVSGSCKVIVDNGKDRKEYKLDKPNQGLIVDRYIWREMYDFSDDCVLFVLASDYYDENDYIRNYEEYLIAVNKLKRRG